jgi:pyoverdine/dityrosine biosynthesis protein Dit1
MFYQRNKAYLNVVELLYPSHLRLSIHARVGLFNDVRSGLIEV